MSKPIVTHALLCIPAGLALVMSSGAHAQDGADDDAPRRTRVALGPQLVPNYPGSDEVTIGPLIDFARARGSKEFAFKAPDESFGIPLIATGNATFGPSIGFEGKRSAEDVGGTLPKVGFSVELGGFAQYQVSENIRFRLEARQAVSGHDGFIAIAGADYVIRDGDRQLVSFGPRVTLTDKTYQSAYFGVRPQDSAASRLLPAFEADGGVQAVGVAAGYIQQFTQRWGIYSYVKYDRLVGDPADSPVVEIFGSRDQFSGGVALSYTFGG